MQLKQISEQGYLTALLTQNVGANEEVYKACVAVACNGMTLPEEATLSEVERVLLDVRRKLFANDLKKAETLLKKYPATTPLLEGDHHFLMGQVHHRRGEQEEAELLMYRAAVKYAELGDNHRSLRARVNGALCVSSLESCLFGNLFVFEQESRRLGFFDITANIVRTRAMELLISGRSHEACSVAIEASELYKLDGYQDDRSVAILVAAIACLTMGDVQKAKELRAEAFVNGGKTQTYISIYDDLIAGKLPKVPKGHALSRVSWKKVGFKTESVTGKIIDGLRQGPKTRDELIAHVWGESATNASYCSRLYVAVGAIRKEGIFTVIFDGESYKLV